MKNIYDKKMRTQDYLLKNTIVDLPMIEIF